MRKNVPPAEIPTFRTTIRASDAAVCSLFEAECRKAGQDSHPYDVHDSAAPEREHSGQGCAARPVLNGGRPQSQPEG